MICSRWVATPTTVNAFYSATLNSVSKLILETFHSKYATMKNRIQSLFNTFSIPSWNSSTSILRQRARVSLNFRLKTSADCLKTQISLYRAINYGSIGAIMGHEVTHGFDDQGMNLCDLICEDLLLKSLFCPSGRRYDEHGNLKQWWSAATLEHYHGKVQCIIDQYNQYHLAQLPNYTVSLMKIRIIFNEVESNII